MGNIFFSVLPCPEQPPPYSDKLETNQHVGGSRWYHIEFTRYQCPPGKEFATGAFPYWYSNCTVEKLWDPSEVEECVGNFRHFNFVTSHLSHIIHKENSRPIDDINFSFYISIRSFMPRSSTRTMAWNRRRLAKEKLEKRGESNIYMSL